MGRNGTSEVKEHDFFKNINWNDIYDKKIKPNFIPKITHAKDIRNFDRFFTDTNIAESPSHDFEKDIYSDFTYEKNGISSRRETEEKPHT